MELNNNSLIDKLTDASQTVVLELILGKIGKFILQLPLAELYCIKVALT